MKSIIDIGQQLRGLYVVEEKETWWFLYTKHKDIKKATNKNHSLKEGNASKSAYIITEGKDYAECLQKAKQECKFNDNQLIGSRRIDEKDDTILATMIELLTRVQK